MKQKPTTNKNNNNIASFFPKFVCLSSLVIVLWLPLYNAYSYTWEDIKQKCDLGERLIVIERDVCDITNWSERHPGGAKIISHYIGQDATDAYFAFHIDKSLVAKFKKSVKIGTLQDTEKESPIAADFRRLRQKVESMNMFQPKAIFFVSYLLHIVLLDVTAYFLLLKFGNSWLPYVSSAILLTIMQAQAGWIQHDYGHLSVLSNSKLNHLLHQITIGFLKGASSHWWNFRHSQHHAKPNIAWKDPDISVPYLFLIGSKLPLEWARKRRGLMPYQHQHKYFFILGPTLLLPIYFHYENLYFVFKRRNFVDLSFMLLFFAKHFLCYTSILGFAGAFWFYMFVRFLESHWFVWVTQMNHIPMEVERDQARDWVPMQLAATCNVTSSWFNDWFTGHLNYQIEHHLFPTMPRHNYAHVSPLVRALCEKHNIKYTTKTLFQAFADVVTIQEFVNWRFLWGRFFRGLNFRKFTLRSLKTSGQLYVEAYYHL